MNTLVDILTKREYLYKEYFLNRGYTLNLPKYLLSTPNNSLLTEIKSSYSLVDPSSFSSEVSRDFFYSNTSLFRFNILKNFLYKSSDSNVLNYMCIKDFSDLIFLYIFNTDISTNINNSSILLKNQHRPMRKGISNMIKLHASGAIGMPTELRIHILASSKDIIHS